MGEACCERMPQTIAKDFLSDFPFHAPWTSPGNINDVVPVVERARPHFAYVSLSFSLRGHDCRFEILFANWGPPCRVLVENVNEWFSLFFLLYRCSASNPRS